MKLIGLPGALNACYKYRMEWPWTAMWNAGYLRDYAFTTHVTAIQSAGAFDIAIFQRQHSDEVYTLMCMLKRLGQPVIFDIDDNALNIPSTNPNYLAWGRDWRTIVSLVNRLSPADRQKLVEKYGTSDPLKVAAVARSNFDGLMRNIRQADAVTVTTPHLANIYRRHNKHVHILPNQIRAEEWQDLPYEAHPGEVWIGWAGGPTHAGDFHEAAQSLRSILQRFPHVRLCIVGFPGLRRHYFPDHDRVMALPWMDIDAYRQHLASWDIVIAPTEANDFNRGKSDIRILEGLLATQGRAAILASECTYGATVRAAKCGYVAKNRGQWYRHLTRLVKDGDLRQHLGQQGYRYVLEQRLYKHHAHEWYAVYADVAKIR